MMDLWTCKQRREAMIREAEKARLARALRALRKRQGADIGPSLGTEAIREPPALALVIPEPQNH
jgi:hypothetical protein